MEIESDAKVLIDEVNGKRDTRSWRTAQIVDDIKEYSQYFTNIKFGFVKRSANAAAHWVAQKTIKRMCPIGWVDQPPSLFVFVLNNDGLPAPPIEQEE